MCSASLVAASLARTPCGRARRSNLTRHRSDVTGNDGACPDRAQRVEGLSRRDVFRAAAAITAAPFLLREADAAQRPPAADDAGTLGTRVASRPPPRASRSCSEAAPSSAWTRRSATSPEGDVLIDGKKIVSVGAISSNQGPAPGAGDRRHEHDHHSRVRRCAPPFVGRPASPHHSGRRHRRIHGDHPQWIRALLSPARYLRRQPDHRARAASMPASRA